MSLARQITAAMGGDWHGSYGCYPGPGHSRADRSMKVIDGPGVGNVTLHSFAGDDWRPEKNRLRRAGLLLHVPNQQGFQRRALPRVHAVADRDTRMSSAMRLWDESAEATGTLADRYLRSRGLKPSWTFWQRRTASLFPSRR